jgi:hypothetical protein
MIVQIPLGFKDDIENMDQCDILFIASLTLFHHIYGTESYVELETPDIRSLVWQKIENDTHNLQSASLLKEFADKGWIEYGNGTEGIMVRICKPKFGGFYGSMGGCALIYKDASLSVELTDIRAIMKFCYLLGRLANVTANSDVYESRQQLKLPKSNKHKNVVVVPMVYIDQLTYDSTAPKKNRKLKNEESI